MVTFANKISLNAAKTELIIFRKPLQKIPNLKIKIHGKRISPVSSLKYLGIFLDCYLNGSAHCFQLITKLQRATGMIAKTRHYIRDNPSQLLSLYHSIFSSHMIYGCQTWGLVENKYTKKSKHSKTEHYGLFLLQIIPKMQSTLVTFTQN